MKEVSGCNDSEFQRVRKFGITEYECDTAAIWTIAKGDVVERNLPGDPR